MRTLADAKTAYETALHNARSNPGRGYRIDLENAIEDYEEADASADVQAGEALVTQLYNDYH
ncbi:MAG TPA: hypothetical protein VMT30_01855 [Candidatus Saccharimonadia bacterium]|nr:hypothetical protein [Candidatus Saccharimonadia bacterium]